MNTTRNLQQHHHYVKKSPSKNQFKRRKCFVKCCNIWNLMSEIEKKSWRNYGRFNNTDFNNFLSLNLIRCFNDLEILTTCYPDY